MLKAEFDARSAELLHQALERGMLAAIAALGARAAKGRKLAFAATSTVLDFDRAEAEWSYRNVLGPLNARVRAAVAPLGDAVTVSAIAPSLEDVFVLRSEDAA